MTWPEPAPPAAMPPGPWTEAPPPRPPRPVDLTVTIIELVLMVIGAGLAAFLSLFLALFSDSCGSSGNGCDTDRIAWGVLIGVASPVVVSVIALIVSVVLMVKRRLAFWVPLVAVAVWIPCFVGAVLLASSGVN